MLTTSTGKTPELRRVAPTDPVATRAREVSAALRDAAQDLGLSLDLTAQLPDDGQRDLDLIKRAGAGTWVISPRLESNGSDSFVLRIFAVPPKSATMMVRIEKVDGPHVSARAVVMLRDFVSLRHGASPQPVTAEKAEPRPEDEAARSRGRPILAASSTLFGLYAAFSVHRSSQSDDPRLLYPLLALGSGVGLGASLLAADEWNVTPADAWTIAGGTWWGVAAGLNIAAGRNVQPTDDRYGWGLLGGLAGTTLAVGAVALGRHDDGDAALVHSGAGLGLFTGGIVEGIYCGRVGGCESHGGTPTTGFGYGAALGLVGGSVIAALADTSAQRVLFVDLGAGLGALAGASLGSRLVFREKTEPKQRAFLAAVLAGTAIGSTVAWLVTREPPSSAQAPASASRWTVQPQGGVVGLSQGPNGALLPVFGVGATGSF
ncbi:MAG: hypothetical protein NVS3B10_01580 [Polyangiales bacterium]